MLLIQDYIDCFPSLESANKYLQRNLGIVGQPTWVTSRNKVIPLTTYYPGPKADLDEPIVAEANGLVLDNNGLLVTRFTPIPFEGKERISWTRCRAEEMIEGNFFSVYFHEDEWHVSSPNSVSGAEYISDSGTGDRLTYANFVKMLFTQQYRTWHKPFEGFEEYCFVFLLAAPANCHIHPRFASEVLLISIYNKETGSEVPIDEIKKFAEFNDIRRPITYTIFGRRAFDRAFGAMRTFAPGLLLTDLKTGVKAAVANPIFAALDVFYNTNRSPSPRHVANILQACRDDLDITRVQTAHPMVKKMLRLMSRIRGNLKNELVALWFSAKNESTPKGFSDVVKDHPLKHILFELRKLDGKPIDIKEKVQSLSADTIVELTAKKADSKEFAELADELSQIRR